MTLSEEPSPDESLRLAREKIQALERAVDEGDRRHQLAQAYLNKIFQSMTDMLFVVNPDFTIRNINLSARVKLGLSANELQGKTLDVLLEGEHPFAPEAREAILKERQFVNGVELRCRSQRGNAIPVLLSANVIRSAKGEPLGLICVARDLTDRIQAEALFRRETAILDVLQSVATAANQAATPADVYAVCLEKICRFAGWPAGHILLATRDAAAPLVPAGISHLEDPARYGKFPEAPEAAGLRSAYRLPVLRKAEVFAVLEFFSPSPAAPDPQTLEVMAQVATQIGRVAERNEAQIRLLQSERMASLGSLVASAAHEMNNPLGYVLGNIELIQEELPALTPANLAPKGAEIRRMLDQIREGTERVSAIVADMKSFSRGEDERYRPVDLHRTLELSLQLAANEIRHRARLIRSFGTIPAVLADEKRLGQVFLNLLVNAAQAIPEGAADLNQIEVTTLRNPENTVSVRFRDTGKGIPPEHLRSIFDPFFTTKSAGGGTGLGLSICQSIVTRMGGTLTVASPPGQGATFTVTLRAAEAGVERGLAPAPAAKTAAAPGATRGRILIIDDEAVLVEALERTLRRQHDVTARVHAREGLELILGTQEFDLILCDLMMPEMTGMDIFSTVREKRPGLEKRFVFMSGGAFTPGASEFLAKTPNALIQKPFSIASVRSLVDKMLTANLAA